jgi:uncharacterized RmlC-like cupin family protein
MTSSAAGRVRLVKPAQYTPQTAQTAGFVRQEIFSESGAWVGITRTPPGSTSAWHHHGDYDTYIYLQAGTGRLEFGPRGSASVDGEPGDFVHISKGVVHRELNTGDSETVALIVRVGSGAPVFNVDRPDD